MVYHALTVSLNIVLHLMDIIVQHFLFRTFKEHIVGLTMGRYAQQQMLHSAINQ